MRMRVQFNPSVATTPQTVQVFDDEEENEGGNDQHQQNNRSNDNGVGTSSMVRDDSDGDDNDDNDPYYPNESTCLTDEARAARKKFCNDKVCDDSGLRYHWKMFAPSGLVDFARWLMAGFNPKAHLSQKDVEENFRSLARMLYLLREYESRFGLPPVGGVNDQEWVLKEMCMRLYASGTPIWVLQPVMERAAEGLMGHRRVNFALLPRSAFMFASTGHTGGGNTTMFRYERGFRIHALSLLERILIRLASFGTNSHTVVGVQYDFPDPSRFSRPPRGLSIRFKRSKEQLSKEILDLASEGTGLFFYTHAQEYPSSHGGHIRGYKADNFWHVEDSIRELFSRLACMEAETSMDDVAQQVKLTDAKYYSMFTIICFRMISSAGAAGLWFGGSWEDMALAGTLAVIVSLAQGSSVWRSERIIFEVVISFVVGFVAGVVSLEYPERTCFGAIAVGAIIDILQGFRLVFSIMELMSKHTLAGTPDFMEAFLFTGLIASFLKFGQYMASSILGRAATVEISASQCRNPIGQAWYLLIMPIASISWAYLFMPSMEEIVGMAMHSVLAYSTYFGVHLLTGEDLFSTFVGALTTTLSAGIVSRFTGKQALGNTVTGLYVLVPGAYLAKGLFQAASINTISASLFYTIIVNSVVIGLGAWSGTLLCSPTILGTNRGQLGYTETLRSQNDHKKRRTAPMQQPPAMLYF